MSQAIFSRCGTYRYVLRRKIPQSASDPTFRFRNGLFVMLNPSTADGIGDDATIRRCRAFAKAARWTDMTVVNLYALRATDPRELRTHPDPMGSENYKHVANEVGQADQVVLAWGSNPMARGPLARELMDLPDVFCLGKTMKGHPRHPLYVAAIQTFVRFN